MIPRRKPLAAATALMLLGAAPCALAQPSPGPPQQPTPNYRAIIAKSLRIKDKYGQTGLDHFTNRGGIFKDNAKIEHVEVADSIHMVQTNFYGWAWQTCIRLELNGSRAIYAVFIAGNSVVDARTAVAIDHCEQSNFAPLRGAALR